VLPDDLSPEIVQLPESIGEKVHCVVYLALTDTLAASAIASRVVDRLLDHRQGKGDLRLTHGSLPATSLAIPTTVLP
jgi:hypothetical protein